MRSNRAVIDSRTFMRIMRVLLVIACAAACLSAQMIPVYQVVVASDPVSVNVMVSDPAGHSVMGLKKDDFTILEDDVPQTVRDIKAVGTPFNMLVLVDRSVRDKKSPWPNVVLGSVDRFMKSLRGPDRLAVGLFDSRVSVVLDWRPTKSGVRQSVLIAPSDRGTEFFDAIDWALQEMRGVSGRKGVIMYTDGRDITMYPHMVTIRGQLQPEPNYSVPAAAEMRFQETLDRVKASQVPFYFVAIDTDRQLSGDNASARFPGWVSFLGSARLMIEKLAEASGGTVIFPKSAGDVAPLYKQIQAELGSSYVISYKPSKPEGDNRYRRIEVRVQSPSGPCVLVNGTCTVDVNARADVLQVTQVQLGYYAR
jgi:Ca-activated chloride channel homolog